MVIITLIIIIIVFAVKNSRRKSEINQLESRVHELLELRQIESISQLDKTEKRELLIYVLNHKDIQINLYEYKNSQKQLSFNISYKTVNGYIHFTTEEDEYLKLKEIKSRKKFMKYFYNNIYNKYEFKVEIAE